MPDTPSLIVDRYGVAQGMRVLFKPDPEQVLADVELGHGVVLELVRGQDEETWELWAIRLDGALYREPRDMEGDRLPESPFTARLNACWDDAKSWGNDD